MTVLQHSTKHIRYELKYPPKQGNSLRLELKLVLMTEEQFLNFVMLSWQDKL